MKSEDGHYTFYNRSFADHFKITEQEWIGKSDYDIFPTELAE